MALCSILVLVHLQEQLCQALLSVHHEMYAKIAEAHAADWAHLKSLIIPYFSPLKLLMSTLTLVQVTPLDDVVTHLNMLKCVRYAWVVS